MEWHEFASSLADKLSDVSEENKYKETFRVFSKNEEGDVYHARPRYHVIVIHSVNNY